MRYLKKFKMFESAQDVDFWDIFPSDLIDDLYQAAVDLKYFDKGLSLLINTRIGDEHGFSQVFNTENPTSNMIIDLNNEEEIIELFNNGEIPEMEFCIVDDYYINDYNGAGETLTDENTDMGDYTEYDKKILDAVKVVGNNGLGWPDYDLSICEFPWA